VKRLFITFEGTEGSGKSSQIGALAEYLRQMGYDVLTTREPGGTPIGEQVRAVISNLDNTAMHPRTEILLFQASRAQLVEQVIRPHLGSGGLVLSDRYADSTLAYQGYGYQTDLVKLKTLVEFATGGLIPDLTIFFDLDVEEGLRRRLEGGEWNRLDALDLAFYQRVRQGYDRLMQADPGRWVLIDASGSPEQVQAELRRVVGERLGIQK
jgi:dTMP kinase